MKFFQQLRRTNIACLSVKGISVLLLVICVCCERQSLVAATSWSVETESLETDSESNKDRERDSETTEYESDFVANAGVARFYRTRKTREFFDRKTRQLDGQIQPNSFRPSSIAKGHRLPCGQLAPILI